MGFLSTPDLVAKLGQTAAVTDVDVAAHDALLVAGDSLLHKPWSERRLVLETVTEQLGLRVNPYERVTSATDLDAEAS